MIGQSSSKAVYSMMVNSMSYIELWFLTYTMRLLLLRIVIIKGDYIHKILGTVPIRTNKS